MRKSRLKYLEKSVITGNVVSSYKLSVIDQKKALIFSNSYIDSIF